MNRLALLALSIGLYACDGSKPDGNVGGSDTGPVEDDTGPGEHDADGDGFDAGEDCDDNDSSVKPGATEVCDGRDNNCDGEIDEGVTTSWYEDDDGDGFGDPDAMGEGCENPGLPEIGTDCDDGNDHVSPAAEEVCDGLDNDCDGDIDEDLTSVWYADADADGFGDPASSRTSCEAPVGYVADDTDCDDTLSESYPGSAEVCDEVDNNCDGTVDEGVTTTFYVDTDGDGYGNADFTQDACALPTGYAEEGDDCDDADADAYPTATERCDGVDNDCDGTVDEPDAADVSTWYADADGDGYGDPDVATTSCEAPAGTVTNALDCDDTDATLNPDTVWYVDYDGDGYGSPSLTLSQCEQPAGYVRDSADCDDLESEVNPSAAETCNDIDDDCDSRIDDDDSPLSGVSYWYDDTDGDGYGDPSAITVACDAPAGTVADGSDCDDTDAGVNADTLWYIDYDADGYGSSTYTITQCAQPAGYVRDATDCDDGAVSVNPVAGEVCNDIDDDCDGLTDDADSPVSGTSAWYADADGDTYGDASVSATACDAPSGYVADATDCDDASASVYPGAAESWYDGIDSDCDGDDDPSVCDSLPGATTVTADSTCSYPFASSGWSVGTEWTTDTSSYYSTGNSYSDVMTTPVVGNLTDDNGDGVIDDEDTPDVVYTSFYYNGSGSSYNTTGYLRILSGADGDEILSMYRVVAGSTTHNLVGAGGVAIGDLEGDGSPDIVTMTTGGDVIALENDGTFKWVYAASFDVYANPTIADLDGDGAAEVMLGNTILTSTGTLAGTCGYGDDIIPSVAADIDGDGDQEVVVGTAVCERNGGLVWNSGRTAGYPGVGNFDADALPEVVNVDRSNHRVDLLDDDGTLLWSRTLTGSGGGPPVVADFDGDGEHEIGVASSSRFTMIERDGTVKWTSTIDDSSSYRTSASAFDFDGDGDAEVVYADENSVYVYNGATGATIWSDSGHQSGTLLEYPVVADVDRDGQAEIVLASNDYSAGGWAGIHVLGETDGNWASARFTYNQFSYTVEGIGDDLSVPASPDESWLGEWGGVHAQRSWSDEPDGAADLGAVLLGVCEDCTNGEVDVYVSVENTGAVFAPDGVAVSVYGVDGSVHTLIETQTTTEVCNPGDRLAPMRFTVATSDIGADGLYVTVDTGNDVMECDESNNDASWDALTCGP